MIDLSQAQAWITFFNTALALGAVVYAGLTRGSKDNASELKAAKARFAEELEAVRARLAEAERNVQALQAELKHLPDAQDVTELKLAITEMRGSMNVQAEVMSSVARTVQRLEGYLLEKGK